MQDLILLDPAEGERLVRAIEAGIDISRLRHLFTWCQGALGHLLPHRIMVCIQFGESDAVLRIDCLNSVQLEAAVRQRLCDAGDGLALQLALVCRASQRLSCIVPGAAPDEPRPQRREGDRGASPRLLALRQELQRLGLGQALVQCTERLPGGSACFVILQMDVEPNARHAFLLSLLLPCLHMAYMRVVANAEVVHQPSDHYQALSGRELEVLSWVVQGKSNAEIGQILGLSGLTVKNHLQKVYRKLDVHNRVQALARCNALKLALPSTDRVCATSGRPPRLPVAA